MKLLIIATIVLLTTNLSAREVDNYMAWGKELKDSGPTIDKHIKEEIKKAIIEVNELKYTYKFVDDRRRVRRKVISQWYKECELVAHKLMRKAFYSPTYQEIEDYVDNSKDLDSFPKRPTTKDDQRRIALKETPEFGYMNDDEYLKRSIVKSGPLNSPLSRVVNVYGVYAGADKFGHFTSFGVRYLKKIHRLMKKGYNYKTALDKVLDYGYTSEKSYVGMLFTKVFSRGDLEANYQGLVFSSSLCKSDSVTNLVKENGFWSIQNLEDFTMKDYINPNWDESYNHSLFTEKKWQEAVVPNFISNSLCEKLNSNFVTSQRAFYNEFNTQSYNKQYESKWIKKKFKEVNPNKFSLDNFCNL